MEYILVVDFPTFQFLAAYAQKHRGEMLGETCGNLMLLAAAYLAVALDPDTASAVLRVALQEHVPC